MGQSRSKKSLQQKTKEVVQEVKDKIHDGPQLHFTADVRDRGDRTRAQETFAKEPTGSEKSVKAAETLIDTGRRMNRRKKKGQVGPGTK